MTRDQMLAHLRAADEVAREAAGMAMILSAACWSAPTTAS